jgi:hypothetical protein
VPPLLSQSITAFPKIESGLTPQFIPTIMVRKALQADLARFWLYPGYVCPLPAFKTPVTYPTLAAKTQYMSLREPYPQALQSGD